MLYSASPVRAPGLSVWDCTELRRHGMWCPRVEPALRFLTDSSKELEELRSAFARALEYLKQEVEERKCALLPRLLVVPLLVLGPFQSKVVCLSAISLLLIFIHLPVSDLSCNTMCCLTCGVHNRL